MRKLAIIAIVVGVIATCSVGTSVASQGRAGQIKPISVESACPVAGCAYGYCHAADEPPQPDGTFLMTCPRTEGCTSAQCHAWEGLTEHYNSPSSASLTLWILAPVVAVLLLVAFIRGGRKGAGGGDAS